MGRWMSQEGQGKKTTSDRWNRNWSRGRPHHFPKGNVDIHRVPTWEQNFCHNNGVSWQKLLKAKRFLDQYPRIVNWDDSASKEAFEDAKARQWAHIRGLQPLPLPDRNACIDEIGYDAPPSDPTLYENLWGSLSDDGYDGEEEEAANWGEGGVILLNEHYCKVIPWYELPDDHRIIPTGWHA